MRVLHLDTGMGWRGGQQQVFYLHRELTAMGVDSALVCQPGGELFTRAGAAGLPVADLPLRGEWDVLSARAVARLIREEGVTHLHLHSSHAQGIGMMAAFMARFLNVIVTRRVDFKPSKHLFNRWKYGPGVARFVAISTAIRDILLEFGVPQERVRLVPSGVDPDKPRPGSGKAFRAELGIGDDELLVGNIAALADHKGQKYLVDAVPSVLGKVPNARFVIAGAGEEEAALKKQAAGLGLGDRLIFAGFRDDVEAVMDALDLFVMSSHMEGLGTIVLDAMAAAKPVVATAAGGIVDAVEDGADGLLAPPRDPQALAEAMVKVLSDPALAARLAAAGREKVLKRFSARAMAEGNLAVYEELNW